MVKFIRSTVLASGLLVGSAIGSVAHASLMVSSSLYTPLLPVGTTNTIVALQGVSSPSHAALVGAGYKLSFSVAANQGLVHGASSGNYAAPVAGVSAGSSSFLSGDLRSTQTTDISASGNYLSTGTGTITLTFLTPETSLALLWGSIDQGNSITFDNGDTLTGAQVQTTTAGFVSNGFQGPGGSAYVVAVSDTPFTTVSFSSSSPSFEFAGVVASGGTISTVPLPAAAPMFGAGLLALAGLSYGTKRRATSKGKKLAATPLIAADPI